MAKNGGLQSPNHKNPTSIPKLFTLKSFTDTTHDVVVMSPTSILDISKSSSAFKNPFWPEPKSPSETRHKLDTPKGIGLVGIVDDALKDTNNQLNNITPEARPILFGSRLRIQIPPLPSSFLTSPSESPKSEFSVKITNSNSQTHLLKKPVFGSEISGPDSPMVLSASEMELSEDYTCVITHGPNPKTTHIFDNCIVESCCGVGGGGFSPLSPAKKVNGSGFPSGNFLSFCYTCKKDLGQGKDIYMGEKAFCSHECRYQEILLEEEEAFGKPEI